LHITFGGQCVIARASQPREVFVTIHSPSAGTGIGSDGFAVGIGWGGGSGSVGRGGFTIIVGVCDSGGGGVGCGSVVSGWPGFGCETDCEGGVRD
jgi:hypothetical protein